MSQCLLQLTMENKDNSDWMEHDANIRSAVESMSASYKSSRALMDSERKAMVGEAAERD